MSSKRDKTEQSPLLKGRPQMVRVLTAMGSRLGNTTFDIAELLARTEEDLERVMNNVQSTISRAYAIFGVDPTDGWPVLLKAAQKQGIEIADVGTLKIPGAKTLLPKKPKRFKDMELEVLKLLWKGYGTKEILVQNPKLLAGTISRQVFLVRRKLNLPGGVKRHMVATRAAEYLSRYGSGDAQVEAMAFLKRQKCK